MRHVSSPINALMVSHGESLSGGAERSLLEVARGLVADGRVVPTVTVPEEGPLEAALRESGIRVVVVPTPFWAPYGSGVLAAPSHVGRLYKRARVMARTLRYVHVWLRVLRDERPDVVMTNTVTPAAPALAAKTVGIPHVWMIHEFLTLDHGLEYALGEPLSQRIVGTLSARVIVNSEVVGRHFSPPIPARKLVVAYPPVEVSTVGPNDVESGPLRLLLLGRQTTSKGSALAVEALGLLRDCPDRPILRLVGWISEEFRAELEALANLHGVADRIEIMGGTDEPFKAIEWANALLMCSSHEAFGRVTAEALKCGRPVVGSRSGGTPEIVTDGDDGLLFHPGNATDLAAAVGRLAGDKRLLRRLGERAQERNADRFTLREHVGIVVETMQAVTGVSPTHDSLR
jgi:glycosyltransferase involved in cell wall biosynthesis